MNDLAYPFSKSQLDCIYYYVRGMQVENIGLILQLTSTAVRSLLGDFIENYRPTQNASPLKDPSAINGEISQLIILNKQTLKPVTLAVQLSKCMRLLARGYSAKEISENLHISRRTVDHYLERIRKQLGCASSKELIALYNEQLKFI